MSKGHLISVTEDTTLPVGDFKQLWFCVTSKLWVPFPWHSPSSKLCLLSSVWQLAKLF